LQFISIIPLAWRPYCKQGAFISEGTVNMNRLILQIGILAFCIVVLLLSSQSMPLTETIARSFLMFMAVVIAGLLLVLVTSMSRTNQISGTRSAQGGEQSLNQSTARTGDSGMRVRTAE
jgi:hypothetical protein